MTTATAKRRDLAECRSRLARIDAARRCVLRLPEPVARVLVAAWAVLLAEASAADRTASTPATPQEARLRAALDGLRQADRALQGEHLRVVLGERAQHPGSVQ